MTPFLSISNLSKSFNGLPIVYPLNLDVEDASVIGIAAPEESGKSTLLRMLAGVLLPGTGTVWARITPDQSHPGRTINWNMYRNKYRTRNFTAYIPQTLSWWQTLRFQNKIKYLEQQLNRQPAIVFIDEPLKQVSVSERQITLDLIESCRKRRTTVVIASSNLDEVGFLDRLILMYKGKIGSDDTPEGTFRRFGTPILMVRTTDMVQLKEDFLTRDDVLDLHTDGDYLRIQFSGDPKKMDNAALVGVYVMSITAWLALKGHAQIEVNPATVLMSDCYRRMVSVNSSI